MTIIIKKSGEVDAVALSTKDGGKQVIDMTGLEGRDRNAVINKLVNWWCKENKFAPIHEDN